MRITAAFNLRADDSEHSAKLLSSEEVKRLSGSIASLGHAVSEMEVSGKPHDIVNRLLASEPDLIFQ